MDCASLKEREAVERHLRRGTCAALVLAGGDGSRLGWNGPKGCYPITPICHHTLFRRLAEKVLYASRLYQHPLSLAIMTSPTNHAATQAHFVQHHFFGLSPDQVDFFPQSTLPLLNDDYTPIYQDGVPLMAPDGNGSLFCELVRSGILDKWVARGVSCISLLPIDNPLGMPFDIDLIALQQQAASDVVLTVIPRIDPMESVGVVKCVNGQVRVVEYSELTDKEREGCEGDANSGLFLFSTAFIQQAAKLTLPIHYARKRMMQQVGQQTINRMGWKQERFVFDALSFTSKTALLRQDRAECFAPLKQAEGKDSPVEVRQALINYDRKVLKSYLERDIPEGPIELSPCFYYPNLKLKQQLRAVISRSGWSLDGYYGENV